MIPGKRHNLHVLDALDVQLLSVGVEQLLALLFSRLLQLLPLRCELLDLGIDRSVELGLVILIINLLLWISFLERQLETNLESI